MSGKKCNGWLEGRLRWYALLVVGVASAVAWIIGVGVGARRSRT